ncbi:MAG: NAD-dependent malic enzyme [Chloroflexi bacterium]|nr:NAD-dependent malic enzyme [Chloroflexota bacterium]
MQSPHKNGTSRLIRTLRCKNLNIPGTLGRLASTIGSSGADIGNITTVYTGHNYVVRDIDVIAENEASLGRLTEQISQLPEVKLLEVMDAVLEMHKNGKVRMMSTVAIKSLDALRMAYTPGVAEVCQLIQNHPEKKDVYTSIPASVAIVTDGTAVLGLGNVGSVAGMPVMEGKAALLQQLVGISGIPVLLDTADADEVVATVRHIAPTFAGIHLEDIASPRCFEIEKRLQAELPIPVMHDDQHGTAVVVLAALINACKIARISLQHARIGAIGLGAAGLSIATLLMEFTGNPVYGTARTVASTSRLVERGGKASNVEEIMRDSDIVVCTSGVQGLVKPEMVRKGQILLALSNPYPEIEPEVAREAGAAVAADGRSVNNLLGYPGLWRGTLDAKATAMTSSMYKAAALAIAAATREGELVPSPLDCNAHLAVAKAVARAAMDSGVARRRLDDEYFQQKDVKGPVWE